MVVRCARARVGRRQAFIFGYGVAVFLISYLCSEQRKQREHYIATIERAIEITVEVHKSQIDKGNSPYVLHPFRVMMSSKAALIRGLLGNLLNRKDLMLTSTLFPLNITDIINNLFQVLHYKNLPSVGLVIGHC